MQEVTILEGSYRNNPIRDVKAKLMRPVKLGARGFYGNFSIDGIGIARVQLPHENAVVYHKIVAGPQEEETDNQIIKRIEDRFSILEEITAGVANGDVRALIVSGAAGVGKSEGIRSILEKKKQAEGLEYNIIHGNIMSAFQLYQDLYDNSEENSVLVLDDCDNLLNDPACINLLKAALESGNRPRMISYQSQSVVNLGIPKSFEFNGSMVFVTNIDFELQLEKDKAISKHLAALMDRSLYLDLTLHTRREIWCRIKSMITDHGLLNQYEISNDQKDQVLEYVRDRQNDFRSFSLRTALQLAQFIRTNPEGWRRLAEAFQMKNS